MCGIIGYAGKNDAVKIITNGLERLSYRGYDSAGISVLKDGIKTRKKAGKLGVLLEELARRPLPPSTVGIGHTRWATHGAVNDQNSHPHVTDTVSVVHNGIIENYREIKKMLKDEGYSFVSETDTEALTFLIDKRYKEAKSPTEAIKKVSEEVKGAFAIAVIFADKDGKIYATRRESPLVVGIGEGEYFVASDVHAFASYTDTFVRLNEGEIATISKDGYEIVDKHGKYVKKSSQKTGITTDHMDKLSYEHFMKKEIYEECDAVRRLIDLYIGKTGEVRANLDRIVDATHVTVVGCGTAYHAGLYIKYLFERWLRIRTDAVIASEFRYSEPILDEGELVIFISQSGETADTLSAVRAVKSRNRTTLGIVNARESSIAEECDLVVYTDTGPEVAVASTKAYVGQCTLGVILTLFLARAHGCIDQTRQIDLVKELKKLPDRISEVYGEEENILSVARIIKDSEHLFYIGRGGEYLACVEGSLKLKEISYIHSESYPAGELKHGTISLITEKTPVIAVFGSDGVWEKTLSAVKEVKARGATVIAVLPHGREDSVECDGYITLPRVSADILYPIVTATALQLLAYHTARLRGCEVDQPRNLAKSVTVE